MTNLARSTASELNANFAKASFGRWCREYSDAAHPVFERTDQAKLSLNLLLQPAYVTNPSAAIEEQKRKIAECLATYELTSPEMMSNPCVPQKIKRSIRSLDMALKKGSQNLQVKLDELRDSILTFVQYKNAVFVWGSTRPPQTLPKRSAVERSIPSLNVHCDYATPTLVRRVAGANFSPKLVLQQLTQSDKISDHHPIGAGSACSSLEEPRIIYEDGAGPCSPFLMFSADGRAMHLHTAWVLDPWFSASSSHKPARHMIRFKSLVKDYARKGAGLCFAGSNIIGSGAGTDRFISKVTEFLNPNQIVNFTIKNSPEQKFFGFEYGIYNCSRGYIFIPQQLSRTGQNELLMVDDAAAAAMRAEFSFL